MGHFARNCLLKPSENKNKRFRMVKYSNEGSTHLYECGDERAFVTVHIYVMMNEHVKSICQKTNNKVKAFSRVVRDLEPQKASLLYNSFILTNFNYCPFIWMFCGKTTNDMVNRVHKRALRVLLNDYDYSFEELLHKNEEVTIQEKTLKILCWRYTDV